MPIERAFGAAVLSILFLVSGQASAQSYPTKPVRLITAFPPGGTSDALSRLLAQRWSDTLGRQVVVENHPGAGSNAKLPIWPAKFSRQAAGVQPE